MDRLKSYGAKYEQVDIDRDMTVFRILRKIEAFMLYCRRIPSLNTFIRKPLQFFWYASWNLFFSIRNKCLGPRCRLKMGSHWLLVDLRDRGIARHLYWFNIYEPEETSLVKKLVREGMTVVDLGANIGYYTLMFSDLVGKHGRVLSLEPSPQNFQLLSDNLEINGIENVIVMNAAATAQAGKITLHLCDMNFGENRISDHLGDRGDLSQGREVTVDGVTLDEALAYHGIKPEFIKMDIEGAEPLALHGMRKLLRESKDILILFEFNPTAIKKCGTNPENYVHDLHAMNFEFYEIFKNCRIKKISPEELINTIPEGKHFNILASRKAPASGVVVL